jgi:hypothetical protein
MKHPGPGPSASLRRGHIPAAPQLRRLGAIVLAAGAVCLPLKAPAADGQASIAILREGQRVKIDFAGVLLSADDLGGTWEPVPDADAPHIVAADRAGGYFRAGPYGTNSIFSSTSLVTISVSGPLQAFFDLAYAGTPDGIFPPVRQKPYFEGGVSLAGFALPVSLRVRGNSSLQECPFPKLKFKVAAEHRVGTPFADAREVKIGTHCAEGGRGGIGRLRDQTAAFREVLAYEALRLTGFHAPRVRRARIVYQDTTPPTNEAATVGWRITREALLLEDIEVLAARLGARVLDEVEITQIQPGAFDAQLAADMQFFHALIGNWDYSLAWDSRGVWNTEVLEMADESGKWLVPVAGDFDLASWVTGIARRRAPRDYHPEMGDIERETRYELEQIQKRCPPAVFAAARERFFAVRPALESHLLIVRVDDEGRAIALRHFHAFYDALDLVRGSAGG